MRGHVLVLFAALAACGGTTTVSGGGNGANIAACSVGACGGDVVGKWRIVSYCGDTTSQVAIPGCTEPMTTRVVGLTATGTVEYRSDGTYAVSMTSSGTAQVTYPAACLTIQGVTMTCDQLSQASQQQAATMADAGITSYTCAGAGDCTCTATVSGQTTATEGTYSVNGTVLTQGSGSSQSQADYCVQGNQLTETPRGSGADGGATQVSSGLGFVLEKVP